MKKETVFLALSGGVDSAVAAALLLEQGYNVRGIFLKIWSDDFEKTGYCPWVDDRRDAIAVAAALGIPIETVDFEQEYKQEVFSYFVHEYTAGRTPNPDILCNEVIKFGRFLDWALEQGADYIATGHHVRRFPEKGKAQEKLYEIHEGIDQKKDQSYFLSKLNQHQIRHTLFPIGSFTKEEVRQKAQALGLHQVARKRSTRGICFIGDVNLKDFLSQYTIQKPGVIVNQEGKVLGEHDGVAYYTIGQRKGLRIKTQTTESKPYFVLSKHAKTNTLVVSQDEDALGADVLICEELHWNDGKIRKLPLTCEARIRYNQSRQLCTLRFKQLEKNSVFEVIFSEIQRAIAPGQVIAFYDGDTLLGSAVIS